MPTVEETARFLAGEHAKEDEGTRAVYWSPAEDEVRLIEVTTSMADRGEVLPFRFIPDPPDVPYPTLVILLGPGDWERVRRHDLELPSAFDAPLTELVTR